MAVHVGIQLIVVLALAVIIAVVPISQAQTSGQPPFFNQQTVHVYVDDEDGNDETCLESQTPCRSLEYVAEVVSNNMSSISRVEIVIHSELELRDMVTFNNVSEIKLVGSQAQNNVICAANNDSSVGLIFTAIQTITIENLTFSRCGAFQRYIAVSIQPERLVRAAIHIVSPTNVIVTNVILTSNNGTGLFITNVKGGIVRVYDSMFDHNMVNYKSGYDGGSGVSIWQWQFDGTSNDFVFENCLFLNNRAYSANTYIFLTAFNSLIDGSGRGGGIEIFLTNSAASNSISVSNCNFTGNAAFLGGGLAIFIQNNSCNNSVLIQNSVFVRNGLEEGVQSGIGGGAIIGFNFRIMNWSLPEMVNNQVSFENVTFAENYAEFGGGTTFYSSRSEYLNFNNNNRITFSDCKWIANNARLGAAVDIRPHVLDRLTRGFFPTPVFRDCEFISNSVAIRTRDFQYTVGTGALFSSLLDVTFESSVLFMNNLGTAFIIVDGVADFSSCNATFINNTGVQGGAIALIGGSSLLVGPECNYTFQSNEADQGGAIYVRMIDEHDISASRSCYIQYSENLRQGSLLPFSNWTCRFFFIDNVARFGHAMFATSFMPCQLRLYGLPDFESSGVFVFENVTTPDNQLATDGATVHIIGTLPFRIIPGQEHILEVEVLDDLNQTTNTPIRASIMDLDISNLTVDDAFSCVSGNAIRLLGEEGEEGDLLLQSSTTTRKNSIIVNVTLSRCPTGFALSDRKCACDAHSYVGITHCDHTEFRAYLEEGFWAGYRNNVSELVTSLCPEGFCRYNGSESNSKRGVKLPCICDDFSLQSELDEIMCGPARTGILCGNCIVGYTVYYNSPSYICKDVGLCNMGWLFYILSELVPVTILFVIVLVFNVSFTSGSINGFILFSQVLDTLYIYGSGVIKVSNSITFISWGYYIIYGFFGLNFFNVEPLSFCLLKNATVLDILAFKYITIVYSFILILSVIMFMRHCAPWMLGRHFKLSVIKNSVIHGLSTFVVVCYAQCINVSLNILLPQPLRGRGGHSIYPRRVWFNGEIELFSREHLPYAIPALLFLLIVGIILPVLLIAYPLVNKLLAYCGIGESHGIISPSKRIHISKLKPFLDSFQGCFKDNLRFFAGLYFLYRWIGPLAYAASSVSLGAYYAVVEAVLVVVLVVHAVAQPYVIQWHNIVDALLLGNLVIINGFTSLAYLYSIAGLTRSDENSIKIIVSIQLIFIYLPILFYAAALVLIVCHKHCLPKLQKLSNLRRSHLENKNLISSDQLSTSASIPLEEFPARLLGDDVEYEEFPSNCSPTPENDSY